MDLTLNERIEELSSNDPKTHRYIMKAPFSTIEGRLPYDQVEREYMSYGALMKVRIGAKLPMKD